MTIDLTDPIFNDEDKAREHVETVRWPNGPICPHCGCVDKVYRLHGASHRHGLVHCNNCDGAFTVTTGTVMESSHVPLTKWVLAYRLMASAKKGISAHQLHRTIGVTYKTAWFMAHRIRESMRDVMLPPLGGDGKVVEADETYVGGKPRKGGPDGRKTQAGPQDARCRAGRARRSRPRDPGRASACRGCERRLAGFPACAASLRRSLPRVST